MEIPMTTNYFQYLVLFTVALYILYKPLITRKLKNLPPCPPISLPILGHLYLFKKPLHRSLAAVAASHGSIVYLRFGSRSVLLLSSPEAVEECLVKNDAFVDRPHLLPGKYGGYNFTNIAWAPYGPHWRNLRRISAVEILSPQSLQVLNAVRIEVARCFVRRMTTTIMASGGEAMMEMKAAIFGLTLDNMMRMLVGKSSYGEGDLQDSKRFQELMEESFRLGGASNIEDFLPILKWLGLASSEKMLKKLKEEKDIYMQGLIEEHRKMEREGRLSEMKKKSMLHVLLGLQKEDPQYYSDEMIRSLILALFQGGTDTSAGTTVWALTLLLNHPEVLKKAQAEIDQHVGHDRLVEESDRNNIPYIKCIVNETFRLFPTGPLGLPRESRVDCTIGGYHVPRGSMLIYNIWAIHNDPKIWEDPRQYKPERFDGVDGNRVGYKFLPFGTGKRACPGEQLAARMVWYGVAIMAQCFDWDRVGNELVDTKEGGGLSLAKQEPLHAKCRLRPCMMKLLSQI